ncbi:hypothetical protein B0H10DRAFT_2113520 [Mycena sp. CBHHK59/15]|nr:hypothetical protein B0H10DRAFT_2113520 [Mycena sp. CBHHK59/15]
MAGRWEAGSRRSGPAPAPSFPVVLRFPPTSPLNVFALMSDYLAPLPSFNFFSFYRILRILLSASVSLFLLFVETLPFLFPLVFVALSAFLTYLSHKPQPKPPRKPTSALITSCKRRR